MLQTCPEVPLYVITRRTGNAPPLQSTTILEGYLTAHLPHEIKWNANLMQLGNFIDVFLARHVSGTYVHHQGHEILCTAPSAPYKRPTQRLSRPPPIQKLGTENHMLQLNISCLWWWTYVPETCRAKNTSIKLPSCIKLAFHFIPPAYVCLTVMGLALLLSWLRNHRLPSTSPSFNPWVSWLIHAAQSLALKMSAFCPHYVLCAP